MAEYVFCTTFNKKLYDEYAHQLIDTFVATKQIAHMYVYVEDNPKFYPQIPKVQHYNIVD